VGRRHGRQQPRSLALVSPEINGSEQGVHGSVPRDSWLLGAGFYRVAGCQDEEPVGYLPLATTISAGLKSRGGRGARVAAAAAGAGSSGCGCHCYEPTRPCGALAAETDTNSFETKARGDFGGK